MRLKIKQSKKPVSLHVPGIPRPPLAVFQFLPKNPIVPLTSFILFNHVVPHKVKVVARAHKLLYRLIPLLHYFLSELVDSSWEVQVE